MDNYNNYYMQQERTSDLPATFAKVMRNVYTWMALGLAMTALTAMIVADSPALVYAIFTNKVLFWGMLLGELGLVFILSARINKMSFATAGLMFALYAIVNGVTLSSVLLAFTSESVTSTFLVTAGTFGAMSLIGYTVKKDLTGLGNILFMLLIGLIIATLVNIFMHSSGLAMIMNYAGVIIFVGLTAYDTQKIKLMVSEASQYGETDEVNKLALMGSLALYLDFVNLFLYLLRFLGDRK